MKRVSLLEIIKTFFKIGLTCWGGPAIVASIKKESVEKKGWLTKEEFNESLAFCQMFPGPIAVQTSGHLGYRLRGFKGSFLAFFFYVLPTFIFMLILSYIYFKYEKVPSFIKLFDYLGVVIVAIIVDAIWTMRESATKSYLHLLLTALCTIAFILKFQVVLVLLFSGLMGIILFKTEKTVKKWDGIEIKKILKKGFLPLMLLVLLFCAVFVLPYFDPILKSLSLKMAKINLLSFGGGYTAIALMHQEAVLSTQYLKDKEFVNGLALGQITPGPVIITGTFIGYKVLGLIGAIISTIYVLLPSYLILLFFSPLFKEISHIRYVKLFTSGLLSAFLGMLLNLVIHLSTSITDLVSVILLIVSFVLLRFKVSPIFLVVLSVILSAFLSN
jgi:chromate transporter